LPLGLQIVKNFEFDCLDLNSLNITENATILNKDISQKDGIGSREGESCAQSFFGIVAYWRCWILKSTTAHRWLRDVKSKDTKIINVFGLFLLIHLSARKFTETDLSS
jgi:hypothetical protein